MYSSQRARASRSSGRNFQRFAGSCEPGPQAPALLVLAQVEEHLHDGRALVAERSARTSHVAEPGACAAVVVDRRRDGRGDDVLVVRPVEDADFAARGMDDGCATSSRARARPRSGRLNETTRQPCGFSPVNTRRIVPSLPDVSMPCSTSSTARCFSAHRRFWRTWSRSTSSARRAVAMRLVLAVASAGIALIQLGRLAGWDDEGVEHAGNLTV